MGQTYYEILGVTENATAPEIEAAFKAKAREVHPETVPPENTDMRKVAAEAFKDLSEAKAALLDPRCGKSTMQVLSLRGVRNKLHPIRVRQAHWGERAAAGVFARWKLFAFPQGKFSLERGGGAAPSSSPSPA